MALQLGSSLIQPNSKDALPNEAFHRIAYAPGELSVIFRN
jgi:hypothetical protein